MVKDHRTAVINHIQNIRGGLWIKVCDHYQDDHLECLDIKIFNITSYDDIKFSVLHIDLELAAAFYYPDSASAKGRIMKHLKYLDTVGDSIDRTQESN